MLTPEQIDTALGNLQQQIDDLRADLQPEPSDDEPDYSQTVCWHCGCTMVHTNDGLQCTNCMGTHPDPAVAQLQRAVKQAGERLAQYESYIRENMQPHLDHLSERVAALEDKAQPEPEYTLESDGSGRVWAVKPNTEPMLVYDPNAADFPPIDTRTARYTPQPYMGTVPIQDFPPIAGQEQVAAAYAARYGSVANDTITVTNSLYGDHAADHNANGVPWGTPHDHGDARLNGLLIHAHGEASHAD